MKRLFVLLAVALLSITLLGCSPMPASTIVKAVTPPVLPTYVAITATPTREPVTKLIPSEYLKVSDGESRIIWIRYLGAESRYDRYQCWSNAPGQESNCESRDIEVHQIGFIWDFAHQAVSTTDMAGGEVTLLDGWRVIERGFLHS